MKDFLSGGKAVHVIDQFAYALCGAVEDSRSRARDAVGKERLDFVDRQRAPSARVRFGVYVG